MQWDWQDRRLRLSVGELARFSLAASADEAGGRWRAQLGTHWHTVLRERTEATGQGWTFEQAATGSLIQDRWTFDLQGRIDQLRPGPETPVIREIKTVSIELPANEADLRKGWPQHFHQAMLYGFLMAQTGPAPDTELVFLDIQTGTTQTVRLGDDDLRRLQAHLKAVAGILEERRGHFSRLGSISVPPPFPEWREGQPEARTALESALSRPGPVLFEAPTGFGKTGLVLEQALSRLAAGEIERILVLTGKNTGHSPVLDQLAAYKEAVPELAIHAMRSRRDHLLDPELEEAFSRSDILNRWMESGLSAHRLLSDGILDLESVRALGQRHGIPPSAITRILMPYADVWIADYNYRFDPAVSAVLDNIPTFSPARTLLLVDEAHNLPDRTAASRSHRLDAETVNRVQTAVQFARFPGRLPRLLDQLQTLLKRRMPADSLDPPVEADLIGLLREIQTALVETAFATDELDDASTDWLWNVQWLLADWDHPDLPMQVYSPRRADVRIACLDASAVIEPVLRSFRHSILMSATLRPWEACEKETGLDTGGPAPVRIIGESPWLEGCFEVLVDARVDTRFRQREGHLETTCRTIGLTAETGKGCTAVFFPSYRYAEQVLERMPFLFPSLRCELQPRDLPLEEQTDFLQSALLFDDVLFLVLGSRFSEGIDILGGRISKAIVVSPALPEVNALQRARESVIPGSRTTAFRSVYLIPGLRKVSQALGRLVRSPGQRARVLLHGRRFMEPEYQDLLPEYLRPLDVIATDEDLSDKWLRS